MMATAKYSAISNFYFIIVPVSMLRDLVYVNIRTECLSIAQMAPSLDIVGFKAHKEKVVVSTDRTSSEFRVMTPGSGD